MTPTSCLSSPRDGPSSPSDAPLSEGIVLTAKSMCSGMGELSCSATSVGEPENEPESLGEEDQLECTVCSRTRLKSSAPLFQPEASDRRVSSAPFFQPEASDQRVDAIVSCLQIALASCGQVRDIKVERSVTVMSSILIFTQLQGGPRPPARAYDVMQLVKQSLEAMKARLPTVALLSSRVQKEECGYSLRSTIACLPDHAQSYACWDLFRSGYCARREQCRWYHPLDADITRIKVSVRYPEEGSNLTSNSFGAGE